MLMVHIDDKASPCICKSTRAQHTMPNKGKGTAYRRCLNPSCKHRVGIDTTADVARLISSSLELSREWWVKVWG